LQQVPKNVKLRRYRRDKIIHDVTSYNGSRSLTHFQLTSEL